LPMPDYQSIMLPFLRHVSDGKEHKHSETIQALEPLTDKMLREMLVVPGHNESAGKRKPSKTRKGNKYLRSALTEAAQSIRGYDNYLGAQYRRFAARKGRERASIAVAHSIMTIAYYLLIRQEDYRASGSER
jgi:transposase